MGILYFKPRSVYLLTGSALWCGPGCLYRPGWLVVAGGRITAMGSGRPPRPENAVHIDLEPFFLTPGLVDAHVHLALNPGGLPEMTARIRLAAEHGLAGVRDGGDKNGTIPASRAAITHHLVLSASGPALFCPGRYGAFLGRGVNDPDDMKAVVRELAETGVDQIKVLASGPVSVDEFGKIGPPQFSREALETAATAARDHGLKLMVHANGPEAVGMSLQAGAASIEHGYFMGDAALAVMADTGCTWVPTIEPLAALARRDSRRRPLIDQIIDHQVNQLSRARAIGVKTAMGTDAGSPGVRAGPSLFKEMAWYQKAGFDTDALLTAATQNGMQLMNGHFKQGPLAPGMNTPVLGFKINGEGDPLLTAPPEFIGRLQNGSG